MNGNALSELQSNFDKINSRENTLITKPESINMFDVKEVNGEIVFRGWDSDKSEEIVKKEPISGFFIGTAMKLSAYDDNLGKNGGTYRSSYYFSNKKISLFDPTKKGKSSLVISGSIEDIVKHLNNIGAGNPKKQYIVFIYTKVGLMEISTNVTIAIGQQQKFIYDLKKNQLVLTPTLYNKDDKDVPKESHGFLGKLAAKNPPKYAKMSIGEPLENLIKEVDIEDVKQVQKDFFKWRNFVINSKFNSPDDTPKQADDVLENIEKQEGVSIDDLPF